MAKKTRSKSKKNRSFKVHADCNGKPFVRFGGKYLVDELGISCGDRLEMTRDHDMIILRKFSADEVADYETARQTSQAKSLLKKLFPLRSQVATQQTLSMMVAENRVAYSVDEEIYKHLENYAQT